MPSALGRYRLLEALGRGGSIVTYYGLDPELDRPIVVKALALGDVGERRDALEARFLEEAQRAARVSHPALVAIHDWGRDHETGIPFVVQEHVAGPSLAESLAPGETRPWSQALRLVACLGRALQQLHGAGLVHGAVRPKNILLQGGVTPRLADAGIARLDAGSARDDPLYASPEQAVGERLDASSDIFALGSVAYRLVTGRDAFAAEGRQRVLARILHDRPEAPSTLVPALPHSVDDVLYRALAKSRKDRYPTVEALCDDLDDLVEGRPPRHARPDAGRPDTSRFLATAAASGAAGEATATGSMRAARRPLVRIAAGVGALCLVAGLELLRRELEAPGAPEFRRPTPDAERRAEPSPPLSVSELPSLEEPPAAARLAVDFSHTLEKGKLIVSVDGANVLERQVAAAVKKSLLGIKLRQGRLSQVVELPAGRHDVTVRVFWGEDQRVARITGNFTSGKTRRLSAKLARVGKSLSVEWD